MYNRFRHILLFRYINIFFYGMLPIFFLHRYIDWFDWLAFFCHWFFLPSTFIFLGHHSKHLCWRKQSKERQLVTFTSDIFKEKEKSNNRYLQKKVTIDNSRKLHVDVLEYSSYHHNLCRCVWIRISIKIYMAS